MGDPSVLIAGNNTLFHIGMRSLVEESFHYHTIDVNTNNDFEKSLHVDGLVGVVIDADNFFYDDFSIIQTVRTNYNLPVLAVASKSNNRALVDLFKLGIESCITPNCKEKEVVEALGAMISKEKFYCNNIIDVILSEQLNTKQPVASIDNQVLSPRELEITVCLATGMNNKTIAAKLFLSVHTIQTHRKNIMKKLGVSSVAEIVRYAYDNGLVDPG
ncbi:helix-turn-helix transcriptional regulator [Marinigracilibium pacificum]|uniref:Response regulator transcription factor n=1 Tax=Marinigracilibium pacificum TaxID=2729599 RepID=A0A848J4Y8_9BACT|nr:response regulator transcription factor [Marinigracilibium pacificum]NMM49524.1 response regulator transcription factor [Marinigracilibium pacificum]